MANGSLALFGVVLLQPDSVLEERVPDIQPFSTYIEELGTAAAVVLEKYPDHESTGGFIVVAVKPGERSHVWLDFKSGLDPGVAAQMRSALKQVKPITVSGGVVIFAIKVGLWGGEEPEQQTPQPEEWMESVNDIDGAVTIDDLVQMIWPD